MKNVWVNFQPGEQYVLLVADISKAEPSDKSFYTVFVDENDMKVALLVVPLDEYISKYYG